MSKKDIIGRETRVDFEGDAIAIPAKIDTGADGSAVWASDIHIDEENRLCFKLFDKTSPYYTGHVYKRDNYSVARVKSASGDKVLKFRTHLSVVIKGHRIKALFGLCDRSTHTYPVLIGRRTLCKKFIVDVSKSENIFKARKVKFSDKLNQRLQSDPQGFYQEYFLKEA